MIYFNSVNDNVHLPELSLENVKYDLSEHILQTIFVYSPNTQCIRVFPLVSKKWFEISGLACRQFKKINELESPLILRLLRMSLIQSSLVNPQLLFRDLHHKLEPLDLNTFLDRVASDQNTVLFSSMMNVKNDFCWDLFIKTRIGPAVAANNLALVEFFLSQLSEEALKDKGWSMNLVRMALPSVSVEMCELLCIYIDMSSAGGYAEMFFLYPCAMQGWHQLLNLVYVPTEKEFVIQNLNKAFCLAIESNKNSLLTAEKLVEMGAQPSSISDEDILSALEHAVSHHSHELIVLLKQKIPSLNEKLKNSDFKVLERAIQRIKEHSQASKKLLDIDKSLMINSTLIDLCLDMAIPFEIFASDFIFFLEEAVNEQLSEEVRASFSNIVSMMLQSMNLSNTELKLQSPSQEDINLAFCNFDSNKEVRELLFRNFGHLLFDQSMKLI